MLINFGAFGAAKKKSGGGSYTPSVAVRPKAATAVAPITTAPAVVAELDALRARVNELQQKLAACQASNMGQVKKKPVYKPVYKSGGQVATPSNMTAAQAVVAQEAAEEYIETTARPARRADQDRIWPQGTARVTTPAAVPVNPDAQAPSYVPTPEPFVRTDEQVDAAWFGGHRGGQGYEGLGDLDADLGLE